MGISAKEAAELVGMSKQGIIRACRSGKISATKNLNGEWDIEPVELFRVYPPVSTLIPTDTPTFTPNENLQEKVEMLERIIRDKDDVIADLRTRLDAESDERRKLTLMLTTEKQSQPNWWQRLWQRE